jgi:hypothetical protein
MGYYLQAFICNQDDSYILTKQFNTAININLGQGVDLIPMTEELFDQINNFKTSLSIESFKFLTENVEQIILNIIGKKKFAYVEAEYFGGTGTQIAMIWNNNKREEFLKFGENRINKVLKSFGVIVSKGKDEFETLGFHLHRDTADWVNNNQ